MRESVAAGGTRGGAAARPAPLPQSRPGSPEPAAAADAPDGVPARHHPERIVVPRVAARDAAATMRRAAAEAGVPDGRERLRRLAGLVRSDVRNARRMQLLETAIGECLDSIRHSTSAAERWATCEAATWALAWMARTRRAGGSAGGILERLAGHARAAQPLLAAGDTRPARFVTVLATLFADVEACRIMEAGAVAAVAAEIARLVSHGGVPAVTGSAAIVERVARWTAVREIVARSASRGWTRDTETRWRAAASAAVRLLGGGGRALAAAGRMPASFTAPMLDALAVRGGRPGRTARILRRSRSPAGRRLIDRDLHDPDTGIAIIRSGWGRRSVRVLLDYRHPAPRLEIAVADRLLVDGPWQWEAWADGRALEAEAGWEAACWESDRGATYLEITTPITGGRRLERHVVMLPRQRVVMVADAITAPRGLEASLRYRGVLPLAPSLDATAAEETREATVSDGGPRLLAIPLALPEWRAAASAGGLDAEPSAIALTQECPNRLYAPLWLDCDPRRIGRPLTWRQLTVADSRIILPRHQAAGFRVQAGREQWLVYRALDAARNRTLLGCNVSCEFLLGRIRPRGEVARTIEIQ